MSIWERDVRCETLGELNGCEIMRCVSRSYNFETDKLFGPQKVYYDVCIDGDCVETFKTKKQAEKYCKEYLR